MALTQSHYRFGVDSGTESTHTWHAAENTTAAIPVDTTFLLRFNVQATGGVAHANIAPQFQYNRNGAGWVNITTTSSVARAVAAVALTNGGNCTKRLSGTGTFETTGAGQTEDGLSGGTANDLAANGCSETECGLILRSVDLANGDVVQFRVATTPTAITTYAQVPQVTVEIAANSPMAGSSAGTSTASGTMVGRGRLAGTTTGVATAAALLIGAGVLAGSSTGSSTATGALRGRGALVGQAAGISTASGALVNLPSGAMSGTAAGISTAAGTLRGRGALLGTCPGASTAGGTLRGSGRLSGSSIGSSPCSASLAARGRLAGASASTSVCVGALRNANALPICGPSALVGLTLGF